MSQFRHIALIMLVAALLAACGSGRNPALRDPVAQSGASSEEIWYRDGGARVAYTAVARPKQLYAGYGAVRDPALYGQAPATTKTPAKKRVAPKAKAAPPRSPDCPPCPPADAAKSAPQNAGSQASPASSAPAQGAAGTQSGSSSFPGAGPPSSAPAQGATGLVLPPAAPPSAGGAAAAPPSSPRLPLPGMPAATPAPATPYAPAR
jgi:hypothetical protein